ncbi:MAG: hypothetical protein LBC86_07805 [Oscillospiraceae bacterium]|jgi:hypothetical protein|nr:hypothetical protein [Oscillospiraceae bacterium]
MVLLVYQCGGRQDTSDIEETAAGGAAGGKIIGSGVKPDPAFFIYSPLT